MDFVIEGIEEIAQLSDDSVAILHAAGGGWFKEVRRRLTLAGIAYAEIARQDEWPTGPESVVLSTMHSAKGLEFDHSGAA
jgi:superfamily I DNA/RNA helicase